MIDGGLVQADPATLVPYEDSEALVVSAWHDGAASANGRWVAVVSDFESKGTNQINIVDMSVPRVVATTKGSGDGIYVSEEGLALWFDDGRPVGLTPGGQGRQWVLAPTTNPALYGTLTVFGDGRIAYLAGSEDSLEPVDIVMITDGDAEVLPLEVMSGPTQAAGTALPTQDWSAPAVAWDQPRNRALVVSSFANEVTEVSLGDSEQAVHEFESSHQPRFPDHSVAREAYVTGDGTTLLIASRILEVEGDTENWRARDYAADIIIVDIDDWSSQAVSHSVSTLVVSPDMEHVAGLGSSISWDSDGNTERLDSPVYLFDGQTGQPLVGFQGRSGDIVDAGFAAEGAYLYVTSDDGSVDNIDIISVPTQTLVGSLGFTGISLIEEAGLIAFHSESP